MLSHQVIKVGRKIKDIRLDMKLGQAEFAELIGATVPAVSNWENGRNLPNNLRLRAIAKIADTSVVDILNGHHELDTLQTPDKLKDEISSLYNIVKHPHIDIDASRLLPQVESIIAEYNKLFPNQDITTDKDDNGL